MFHQLRQSHLFVMLTLLMALFISIGWANVGVSSVGAHTTSSLVSNSGATATPMPTPALTCESGMLQSLNGSPDSSNVIVRFGNFVWFDSDGNGMQDLDEPGVPDITCAICEDGTNGPPLDITTTDANGAYELSIGVATEGDYYLICASANDKYAFTVKDAGNDDSVDSDFAPVANEDYPLFGRTDAFLVMPGQEDDDTIDAGLVFSVINTPTPTSTETGGTVTPSATPTSTETGGTVTPSATPTSTQTGGTPSPTPTATSTSSVSTEIDPDLGGTVTYTDTQGNNTTIDVPSGAVTDTTRLVFTPNSEQTHPNFSFAGHAFTLDVYQNDTLQEGFMFNAPINVTIRYSDQDVNGINENSLLLYYWEKAIDEWIDAATSCDPDSTYQRDLANNSLSVEICHLTDFSLFGSSGPKMNMLYLPVIQR